MAEATPARIRDGAIEWSNTAAQRGGLRGGVNKQCAQCMLDKESGAPTQAGNGAGITRRHSHTHIYVLCMIHIHIRLFIQIYIRKVPVA